MKEPGSQLAANEAFAGGEAEPSLPVLIYTPYGGDAGAILDFLAEEGLGAFKISNAAELAARLQEPFGLLVLSQECLSRRILDQLAEHLREQPRWSEAPIIVFLDRQLQVAEVRSELERFLTRTKLAMLQRPVQRTEFITIVKSLLAARRRQYSVEGYLTLQQELRRELNHRVKNILATVISIFELTRRQAKDLESMSRNFNGRLQALSGAHEVLYEEGYTSADLRQVIERILEPFQTSERKIATNGAPLRVRSNAAMMIGLSLHELCTNAAKYGALSSADGRVSLDWSIDEEQVPATLVVDWRERGGPSVKTPDRTGYGTTFLKQIFARQFRGGVDTQFRPSGLEVRMTARKDAIDAEEEE